MDNREEAVVTPKPFSWLSEGGAVGRRKVIQNESLAIKMGKTESRRGNKKYRKQWQGGKEEGGGVFGRGCGPFSFHIHD
jgi:hypothetical protein